MPEEKIQKYYNEHLENIYSQLIDNIMENIQKGVFITTFSFSREAKEFAEHQQQKNLKLIDGEISTHLMNKYGVGIVSQQNLKIYKVDNSYFE